MISKNKNIQREILMTTMEELVPESSLFRKVDKYIDFTFIYDEVEELYCKNDGRPSVDPVVLFKLVFIQAIDGIKSMRKTCEKINTDAEYRWFLNIPFGKATPHFSTFSKNYERRFKGTDIFEKIFINIVNQAINYKLIDGTTFFTDSTHKKANANKRKHTEEVVSEIKKRREWLEEEINEERRNNGQKEFVFEDKVEEKKIKVSKIDTESGFYHRDNKEQGFMYLDHRTTDKKTNMIVDCYITKGNVHDSNPYIERMEYLKSVFSFEIKKVALDSGYATLDIKKYLYDNKIFGVIGYRRYGTSESRKKKSEFYYLKDEDIYINKNTGEVLEYANKIDRLGYKTYTNPEKDIKLTRHIKEELNEINRENRLSEEGKKLYRLRKETIERSFADSKCNHGYRYAMYKGIEKNQNYTWLICAAQNMKNISIKVNRYDKKQLDNSDIQQKESIFNKLFNFIKFSNKRKPLTFSN